jgi:propionyl-CoA carboxylase alpha chain
VDGRTVVVHGDWRLGDLLFQAAVDGEQRVFQIARQGIAYRLSHGGGIAEVLVLSPRAAELARYMLEKRRADTSHLVVSPMPGLLVSLSVAEGQPVKAGEPLAVIEAMKMENVLRAERDGVVDKLHVKPGDSLRVDQRILEYQRTP